MRHYCLILIACTTTLCAHAQSDSFFTKADLFFESYVTDGLVEYQKIKESPQTLEQLVRQIADFSLTGSAPPERKAFFINAYNLLVIKQVLENYPTKGPMSIPGFFDTKTYLVAGRPVTLDQLEKDLLFVQFPDPRLHFILVCAAIGCPPLADYAYVPDSLDTQIERKTREVLNINWYVRVYKDKTSVSQVFEWYETDFLNDTTSVKAYINRYREVQIPESHEIDTYQYNWSLNDSENSFRY